MSSALQKNIQLSEKMEFLLLNGDLSIIRLRNRDNIEKIDTHCIFIPHPQSLNMFSGKQLKKTNVRLLEFVNEIFESFPYLYIQLQKDIEAR